MLLAYAVLAVCVTSNAVSSAAAPPSKTKVFYDLEDAANLFKEHVKKYERKYGAEEYNKRFEIFKESLLKVNELNSQSSDVEFALNFFADLTPEEKESYFGFVPPPSNNGSIAPVFPPGFEAPEKLDWRDRGVVSNVKNQRDCGSCYIFSAIGNIEGQYALKHQQCLALSEQQVLDCVPFATCNGGLPHEVMQALANDSNVCMLEKDYPYTAEKSSCKEKPTQGAKVLSGKQIGISDENVLKKLLAQTGPLSVAIAFNYISGYYVGGIFKGTCNPEINHAVLLVGYGEEDGTPYWILKNSWGADWGEKGYFRLIRGRHECEMGTSYTASSTVA